MGLNKAVVLGLISVTTFAWAGPDYDDSKFYTIEKVQIDEISHDFILDHAVQRTVYESYTENQKVSEVSQVSQGSTPLDTAGQVIKVARDLVALGEDIYRLVSKGKPNVTTSYDPISVIPKVNGKPVDLLETETWSFPTKRTYQMTLKNTYNVNVITFRYSVIFSYKGSYEGKGAYITAAQIVPEYVNVLWGFDFNATMKLGGIQNQGTRQNPIAGATLLMQYTSSNVLQSRTQTQSYFITGRGGFKKL